MVTYMLPVSIGSCRKFLPAFHEQDARIADLARTQLVDPETFLKVVLVALAVRETRTRRLRTADTAALQTAVDLGLVEAEHVCWSEGAHNWYLQRKEQCHEKG